MQYRKDGEITLGKATFEGSGEVSDTILDSYAIKSRGSVYQIEHHLKVLRRFSPQKARAVAMGCYLSENAEMLGELLGYALGKGGGRTDVVGSGNLELGLLPTVQKVVSMGERLLSCRNVLLFRDWHDYEKITLAKMVSCSQRLFCPLCGIARANKLALGLLEKSLILRDKVPGLRAFFVTTTVKNGVDLQERFGHLDSGFTRLMKRVKEYRRRGGKSSLAGVIGAAASVEVKIGRGSGEWHPHVHALMLTRSAEISASELSREWRELTADSRIVDVREIDPADPDAILEIAKYSLKFSEMSLESNAVAGLLLRRRRLFRTFGEIRGVHLDEDAQDIDDVGMLDGAFSELLYRYDGDKRKYGLVKVALKSEEMTERELIGSVSRESELQRSGQLWAKKMLNRKRDYE